MTYSSSRACDQGRPSSAWCRASAEREVQHQVLCLRPPAAADQGARASNREGRRNPAGARRRWVLCLICCSHEPDEAVSVFLHVPIWLHGPAPRRSRLTMFLTDPLGLTALASLITSLSSLVWGMRRKR